MDNWALAPLLVRITSPGSTPSWTLAAMPGLAALEDVHLALDQGEAADHGGVGRQGKHP